MNFQLDVSLKPFNTFGIDQQARWYCELNGTNDFTAVRDFLAKNPMKTLILGGGSNILLTKDFDGLVIKNQLKGIATVKEDDDHIWVKAAAGEIWHDFVMHCIERGYAGIENLSLIPGCVGAAPMQNIGAYGVEIKDTFEELEAIEMQTGETRTFSLEDCKFGYRESVFKNECRDRYLITFVTFRLNKTPVFHTSYGAIQEELEKMGVQELSIRAVSQAVINIRSSKLPDPKKIGNAGSFFKNPVVDEQLANDLRLHYPEIPVYPASAGKVKLAAGWLIEKAGWKGHNVDGRYGVHAKQALVLVNYHDATGNEMYRLALDVIRSVQEKFGVTLEREVNLV